MGCEAERYGCVTVRKVGDTVGVDGASGGACVVVRTAKETKNVQGGGCIQVRTIRPDDCNDCQTFTLQYRDFSITLTVCGVSGKTARIEEFDGTAERYTNPDKDCFEEGIRGGVEGIGQYRYLYINDEHYGYFAFVDDATTFLGCRGSDWNNYLIFQDAVFAAGFEKLDKYIFNDNDITVDLSALPDCIEGSTEYCQAVHDIMDALNGLSYPSKIMYNIQSGIIEYK